MRIGGIDIGKSGALAAIELDIGDIFGPRPSVRTIHISDMPLTKDREVCVLELNRWLVANHLDSIWVERVHAMPRDGRVQAFSFGESFAFVKAALRLHGIEPELVEPTAWKKHFNLINQPKDAARHRAMKLMPDSAKWLQRVKDGGRGDALLVAMYGADKMLGRERVAEMLRKENADSQASV